MPNEKHDVGDMADVLVLILAPFAAFVLMVVLSSALRDGDTGWHLATGAWIVAHGAVPRVDPFSFSAAGKPWVAHEWLSEVAMYAAYRAAGWSGLMLLFGSALAALYAMVTRYLLRWQRPGAAALMLVYLSIGLLPFLLARPHMIALPILAAWLIALLRAREAERAPSKWLALLMLLWANTHGSFLFGLALAGLFGLEALIAAAPPARWRVVRDWGLFGALSFAAALATPGGMTGFLYPIYVNNLSLLPFISEWLPANFSGPTGLEIVLLSTLFFLLYKPTRIPVLRLLLLLGVLHLGLQHVRQQMVMLVVGAIVLAEPFGRAWGSDVTLPRSTAALNLWRQRRALAPLLAVATALYIGAIAWRIAVPFQRPDSYGVPTTALAALPAEWRSRPVFNEYSFGGLLILHDIRPFIDGRSDMYGDAFTADYVKIAHGDATRWHAAEARWHFAWTMLPPDNPLVAILDHEPGWRRLYADKWAVIHVRQAANSAPVQAGTRAR